MGKKSLEDYQSHGIDPQTEFCTNDAREIGKQILEWNFEYLLSGSLVAMIIEGIMAITVVRKIIGDTIPAKAAPGTIRGDYSVYSAGFANYVHSACKNIVHASSNQTEAETECNLWFPEEKTNN